MTNGSIEKEEFWVDTMGLIAAVVGIQVVLIVVACAKHYEDFQDVFVNDRYHIPYDPSQKKPKRQLEPLTEERKQQILDRQRKGIERFVVRSTSQKSLEENKRNRLQGKVTFEEHKKIVAEKKRQVAETQYYIPDKDLILE